MMRLIETYWFIYTLQKFLPTYMFMNSFKELHLFAYTFYMYGQYNNEAFQNIKPCCAMTMHDYTLTIQRHHGSKSRGHFSAVCL